MDSSFSFASAPVWSDFYAGVNPDQPLGPREPTLDGINLITWQSELVPVDTDIGITIYTYVAQDLDGSTIGDPETGTGGAAPGDFTQQLSVGFQFPFRDIEAGEILDCDILFAQARSDWTNAPEDPDDILSGSREDFIGTPDIQANLTRELGHAAGLTASQLVFPTLSAAEAIPQDVYQHRTLDFDDKLSLKMAYQEIGSTLGEGGIAGLVIDGDSVDNVFDDPPDETDFLGQIQNTPVFVGRPTNDPFTFPGYLEAGDFNSNEFNGDDIFAVNEVTSQPEKIRLFASVMNLSLIHI